jgi:putative MATE family efflux protein
MTLILGVVFTVVGILMVPLVLKLMNTPESVIPESTEYLTIYFAGIMGLLIYNMGSGILRAIGDSKRPFYFLLVSALTNIVLDLVFVLVFNMGVGGVALATVIAQGLSAIMVLVTLFRTSSCVKLQLSHLRLYGDMLGKIVKLGIPAALQMAITSFSNIFVQSYINYFDTYAMGGWTAYSKIDQLILLPMQSLALASTTFVGQNLGKGNEQRARKGVRTALLMSVVSTVILMIPVMIFAPQAVWFFRREPAVIEFGTLFIRWLSPFYVLCCVNQIYAGALRGSGNTTTPMIIMLVSFVAFRQIYLFLVSTFISNELIVLAFGYPMGWGLCALLTLIYYKKVGYKSKQLVEKTA